MQTDPAALALWQPYKESTSFRFTIKGYNATLSPQRQKDILESFSWMDYKGPIRMKDPELEVCLWEDWPSPQEEHELQKGKQRRAIWIGKKVRPKPLLSGGIGLTKISLSR